MNANKSNQLVVNAAKPDQTANASNLTCLPDEIKPDTIVSVTRTQTETGMKVERETVQQRLDKMKAKCKDGKLVDDGAREIRFYQLQGCWGNPPADYQEILAAQQKELEQLKKKYNVIEITCNATGDMPF